MVDVTLLDCTDPAHRAEHIAMAARAVTSGEVVVLPTDTLYGIGADAFNSQAVSALLAAKGRGRDMPVPVLVGSWNTIDGLIAFVPDSARRLVEAFWPGGLTLIVEHAPSLSWDLGDAKGTVAIRMPLHPVALDLLAQTGPMAVSSANRTGMPPATTALEAQEQLGDSVSIYLDAGAVPVGLPSTIVDLTQDTPRLVRAGAITPERLRDIVPDLVG